MSKIDVVSGTLIVPPEPGSLHKHHVEYVVIEKTVWTNLLQNLKDAGVDINYEHSFVD